MEYMDVILQNL